MSCWMRSFLVWLAFGLVMAGVPRLSLADSLESVLIPGQVIKGHAKLEVDCKNCHARFKKSAQSGLCLDCHKDVAKDVSQKQGYHGRITEQECRVCHTEHKGRTMNIAPLDEKAFDHKLTDFMLKGGHTGSKIACRDCHKPTVKFRDAPSDCFACHKKDDKHKGSLGNRCADCHDESDWKKTRFDHSKTKFPLSGKHFEVVCKDCHRDPDFKNTQTTCVTCHKKDDDRKGHQGHFGTKCESCHSDKDWKLILFDHTRDTKYPLHGKHQLAKCDTCHTGFLFKEKLKTLCVACHKTDDDKKGHKGRFGDKCESCHTEKGWGITTFNHDRDTKYPLRGKHELAKCNSCHTGFLFKEKLRTTCVACHKTDDDKKGHKGRFGDKCESCHSEKTWKTATFNHDRDTKYPLLGKHALAKCDTCHKGSLFTDKLPTVCIACHEKDDKHKGQEGKKCESCHNERDWKVARIDHGLTRFPLLGKHTNVECKKCHLTPAFKDVGTACVGCHEKDDKHRYTLGPRCETCHNAVSWKTWRFDHDKQTSFRLDGGHERLACKDCHNKPMPHKVSANSTCVSCHDIDDVHNGGFGKFCEQCHVSSSFKKIRAGVAGATTTQ
jgi:hypothetical protein